MKIFLNHVLKSIKNVDFNNWFRGNLGISTKDLNSVLSLKTNYLNMLTHVVLLNYFDQKVLSKKKIDLNKIEIKNFQKSIFY